MRNALKALVILSVACSLATTFTACGARNSAKDSGKITVLLPNWAEPPKEALDKFQSDTGIKVTLNMVGYDQLHDKIAIAAASKSAVADVIAVDWSWVTEFKNANVVEPLNLTDEQKKSMPLLSYFTIDNAIYGVPYDNDFRIGYYNTEHLSKAGIPEPPRTWDELVADAVKIKQAGVAKYPLAFTLAPNEGITSEFFWLTLSRTGAYFNGDGSLNKANLLDNLKFVDALVKDSKIIDPTMATLQEMESQQNFFNGSASFMIAAPGTYATADDATKSKVVGKVKPMLVPGKDGKSTTFGLPDGMGISKYAKSKISAKKFIDWYIGQETQTAIFSKVGSLPSNIVALEAIQKAGKLPGGDVMVEQAKAIVSPFPVGVPSWYSEYSTTFQNQVNAMVQGSANPEQVANQMEAFVKGKMK
jgi:multiple sugar transport system substrate-binding protein